MKICVIYAKVELTQKPAWLDGFREKYDKPYEFHVTLKQPCVVEDSEVSKIKEKLSNLFTHLQIPGHAITLTFNSLKVRQDTPYDICIMIDAEKNEAINHVQQTILSTLNGYNQYYKAKYKEYEEHFAPHITIGRDLDQATYEEARKILEQDYTCIGIIREIVLVAVNNATPAESNDPDNQTVYTL